MPAAQHAVSVCLPLWDDNVGYEKNEVRVMERLQAGYPRFVIHPLVRQLFDVCRERYGIEGDCCFVFPSKAVAERAVHYMRLRGVPTEGARQVDQTELHAVCVPGEQRKTLMQYWQHTGEIVSSRRAQAYLESTPLDATHAAAQTARVRVRERIAEYAGAAAEDVYLFPSGMAAIYTAYRVFQRVQPGRTVQFGFPYVDILKIQERFSSQPVFYPQGDRIDLEQLEALVHDEPVSGLFCEVPGNPLLRSPDLVSLSRMAETHRFPIVVDDTLGAICNTRVLPYADLAATSLTKYFSGSGEVMGGSLVLNARRPWYRVLKDTLDELYEPLLFSADALVLEENSRDVAERVQRINHNCEMLCDWLRAHPAVERVNYPKYCSTENYRAACRPGAGYGGLFSMVLKDADQRTGPFFDALQLSKGPNLGTNFTLCCPYTILAHFQELDFARQCGISPWLLRISVGLENPDWLRDRFARALRATTDSDV